jgi:hypothetical protein
MPSSRRIWPPNGGLRDTGKGKRRPENHERSGGEFWESQRRFADLCGKFGGGLVLTVTQHPAHSLERQTDQQPTAAVTRPRLSAAKVAYHIPTLSNCIWMCRQRLWKDVMTFSKALLGDQGSDRAS